MKFIVTSILGLFLLFLLSSINPFLTSKNHEVINGRFEKKFIAKAEPGKFFDAQNAVFFINDVKWGMIVIKGNSNDTNMCWRGGYIYTEKPWNASWAAHKDLSGSTRNSAAINCEANKIVIKGIHFFNVHDGIRMNNARDWLVEHNWGEYIRDDAVEIDHLHSGRIYDSLFDGCYTGISTRPPHSDSISNGQGERIELDRVLLRLQAMPYPYKWKKKSGIIDSSGNSYKGSGIPYGHGKFFKMTDPERNPHFSIKNSVFLAEHVTQGSKYDFPPETLIDNCENNIIIWLGEGAFPGRLPSQKFPNSFKIVTGQEGRTLWKKLVLGWHERHPDVGILHKSNSVGDIIFPKKF